MRRFFTLIVSILFSTAILAYTPQRDTVFEGASARAYYTNASMVRMYANTSIPAFIRFDDPNLTVLEAQALITKLGGLDSRFGFEFIRDERDELGFTHSKYQQTYDGIAFYDGVYVFHTKNGKVLSMNGKCYDAPVNGAIILSEQDALNKAKAFMGAKSYKWEIPEEEAHFKQEQEDPKVTYFPKTMKYIIPAEGDFYRMNPELELCYAFDIYAHEPLDKKRVFVNAKTGTIAFYDQLLQHATVTGTANTAYSGTQTIKTDSTGPVNYRLRETGRGLGVETYNLLKGTSYAAAVDFTDSNNIWNNINANKDQYATDAHWGCEMTYDYFFLKHGRNSINNAGFKLMSYIHYSTNYTNAFWDGSRMTYGDGASPYTPLVAMDIAGHEVTHGLTSNTSNLVYSYESGALNESFSDIFGVSIDFYSRPALANYLMGDGIGGSPFRSMANPNLYSDPDCYNGSFWYTGTADNGGVHSNSGVQNFWYYLMVNGGSGTNDLGNAYTVSRLGLDTAGKIAFRNNTVYLGPSSQHADARFYAIQSAIDLYGCGSFAVKQTTNAWYAVGVGAKWDSTIVVNFTANPTSNCTVPSIHAFTNLSGNGTYQWFFGDGNTSVLKNPSNTYASLGTYSVKLIATCGLKKDSLTKTDYIVLSAPMPVSFTKIKDTVICEKSSIQLFATSNLGPVKWEFQNVIDTVVTVAPLMTSIYRISKANTCQTFYDSIIVTVNRTPKVTGTASALSSCLGAVDTLKGSCTMRSSTILQLGTSTTTTNTNGNTPYNRTWEGSRTQYLIRASELTGIGASAGPIKSIQFNVTNAGSGANHQKNFTIKIGHTSNTNITGAFANIVGTFNTVYGPATQNLPTVGWNTYSFPAPFNWDGVSNIVVEICHDNDLNNTCGTCKSPNATVQYSTLAFNTTYSNFSDNTQRCGTTGGSTSGYTTTRRPNIRFNFHIPQPATASANWLWTPGNMTTANATVIPPTMPTSSYKVVATNAGTSCKDSATVNINVVTPLTINARTDSTICSGSPIRLTATASSGTITWNPGGLVGPSVTVNPLVTTIYIAQVTNACGTARDTVRVTVIPLPTLLARTDSSICATKSINLTASSNITPITWTPGSLTGSPVLVTPTATTAYIAQVSNACGIRRDTVNVAVTPLPTLTARLDSTICAGNSFNLTATSNISPITWNPGALTGGSVFVSPLTSTSYIAQSMDACGIARDTVNVTVIPIPTLTARTDSSICTGATINLTANSNITPITWNPGVMTGASVPVNPLTTTQYYAQVFNACGVKRDTVNVAVILIPSVSARADSTICSGNNFNLTATANISQITWNPGGLTGGSVFVSPTSTTAYIAQVSNMCGTAKDTVNLTVIPIPTLTARADTGICNGQSVWLTANSNISPIMWNPGAMTGSAISVSPSSSTTYTAQVSNACGVKNDTVNIGVTIVPSLSARADSTICNGNAINLTATSNISPITWNPGALTGGSVFVSPTTTTPYIAQVSNACGIAKDTVNVNVILIPSLTSRADTGICNGQSLWLTATSNISPITWNPGSLTGAAVNINPTATTQYIAQVSNACGSKKDTVVISVTNVPTLTARSDSSICAGQSILLTATSNVSPITWTPGGLIGSPVSVSPTVTTNYIAQSNNACGISRDTVVITVIPQPSIVAGPDTSFCNGFPIILHANANLPITWNPGNVIGNYLAFYPSSNTQYIGTVQN
ncbi:MAG: M4 family metallopeptidase [Bacteroidetes bacterium]|nr:M4 family metallopeptidase [Bacteroidota bacterium]